MRSALQRVSMVTGHNPDWTKDVKIAFFEERYTTIKKVVSADCQSLWGFSTTGNN